MGEVELDVAHAGDIISIAGLGDSISISDTVNSLGEFTVIPTIPIDPPLMSMVLQPNDSPLNGKDGDKNTINQILTKLKAEASEDVSLKINQANSNSSEIEIAGRGDLHLGILIEKMRRDGFELSVSPPVIMTKKENGVELEPIEKVTIEAGIDVSNTIIEAINNRKGVMLYSEDMEGDR